MRTVQEKQSEFMFLRFWICPLISQILKNNIVLFCFSIQLTSLSLPPRKRPTCSNSRKSTIYKPSSANACGSKDLIAAAKKKADLLKLKKKYYLQAIFSQRLRFKGFTKPWQQRKLEELCIRVGSGGTPSVQHPEYYNGKIPFLGISDLSGRAVSATQKKITQRGLDNSAAWLVPKGSITLAMYASVGKVAILDIELATSQAFFNMVIPEETCIRDFLFSRLEKADICHEWLPLISTGTQPNLNAAKLKDWELKVPSTQERKTIGEFFHALDDLAAALARKIELLERRKTAYLQRLFV